MIKIGVLTLTGAPQNLLDAIQAGAYAQGSQVSAKYDLALRAISLQPRGSNAAVIYVGDSNLVSSTVYGVRLEAGDSGIPPAPFIMGEFETGPLHYSDWWVTGAQGEFLHILAIPF